MLINFRLRNFTSFKDLNEFSFLADSIHELEESNVFTHHGNQLLHSAVLYGANASGKSNLTKAFAVCRHLVLESAKEKQSGERLDVDTFRLSTETEGQPAEFELDFFIHERLFRYGFAITQKEIVREWLFSRKRPGVKEARLFERNKQRIDVGPQFTEGEKIKSMTRPNALFISVSAQFNGKISAQIVQWFRNLNILSGMSNRYHGYTIERVSNDKWTRKRVEQLLKIADVGIDRIDIESKTLKKEEAPDSMPEWVINELFKQDSSIDVYRTVTFHPKYDHKKQIVSDIEFQLEREESKGTEKLFALAGPLLDILDHGYIMVIDEMDVRLHPRLMIEIIKLFHSPQTNPYHAQLLFTTHNTRLLAEDLFRRDQICFVEKNRYGESELFSLLDIDDPNARRKDASYEKNYLLGKYGAVPTITGFEHIGCEEENES